jgi:hypothetical protein
LKVLEIRHDILLPGQSTRAEIEFSFASPSRNHPLRWDFWAGSTPVDYSSSRLSIAEVKLAARSFVIFPIENGFFMWWRCSKGSGALVKILAPLDTGQHMQLDDGVENKKKSPLGMLPRLFEKTGRDED